MPAKRSSAAAAGQTTRATRKRRKKRGQRKALKRRSAPQTPQGDVTPPSQAVPPSEGATSKKPGGPVGGQTPSRRSAKTAKKGKGHTKKPPGKVGGQSRKATPDQPNPAATLDLDSLIQPVDDGSNYEDVEPEVVDALTNDNRRIVRESCAVFIDEWVQIDNPELNDPTPIPFHLWDGQRETLALFVKGLRTIVLKARQLGFTWLALAYAVWCMIHRPGFRVVGLSQNEVKAKELVRRVKFILQHLPWWLVQYRGVPTDAIPVWDGNSEQVVIRHSNGSESIFASFPASPDAGRSFTASLVILDEHAFQQFAEDIWSAAFPIINTPGGGQVISLSTGARGTWFQRLWEDARAGRNFFTPIFLPWWADPRRDKAWYEQTKANMPTSYMREYPANEAEAFSAGAGAAFPEWDSTAHVYGSTDWYPWGDHWRLYVAGDLGFSSHACWLWFAVHPDGWAVCYREWYPSHVIDAEQAEEVRAQSMTPGKKDAHGNWIEKPQREKIHAYFGPPDAWLKKSDTGLCTAEIFAQHGIRFTKANNDRINGWRRMHEWLKPFPGEDGQQMARLRFTRACPTALLHFPAATQAKGDPEEVDYAEDHVLDAARYFVTAEIHPKPEERNVINRPKPPAPRSKYTGY